jgi:oligoribonuclease
MAKLFWLDMEMTGLNPNTERLLEAAVIVTDNDFQNVASYETTVFQHEEILKNMDNWCKETHGKSGLIARVASGISEEQLDTELCALADAHFAGEKIILCGNTIGQDRKFVEKFLPLFSKRLHYRMLDVSSFKIVFENLLGKKFQKENKHRALDDIRESILELRYYLSFINVNVP